MKRLIVILGQTSTGKSDFAVQIAKMINGEIISADSRQVYKGMNIGSGKITKREMKKIPHHLLDVISPKKVFSVNDFQKQALKKIKEITDRNKTPIICGGTGFYIDSIINDQSFPEVKPDQKLRNILDKKSTEELLEMLKKLDKTRAQNIDIKNRVRLIRAIEIAKALGKIPQKEELKTKKLNDFKILKIGLAMPDEILKEKIKSRLLSRIKKGMIKEIENLNKTEKISWKRLEAFGLEYRYVSYYLKGKLSKNEMIEKLNTEIWHFAKRQKTWFKRDKEIIWINPLNGKEIKETTKIVNNFLLEN